ncbi:oxygen-dependent choline dehydrogenase-like [Ruditapes philippinarum]|uniref:oxygen-dependent choline dehydrogenase-like n=1 Tax=Ruditapes philippinarum TaxID=129788 RepID=UPI00295B4C9B|nr:oxygen-dependent choline dehydrogenase-like [Ruditapes philippinarum]
MTGKILHEAENSFLGLEENRSYWAAGRVLGGSDWDFTDYNGKAQLGFLQTQIFPKRVLEEIRFSYLGVSKKENLDIAINSFVTKVKLNDNVATGVYYIRNNRKYFVRAKKEVILSAGTVKSPQILMLSGIGPKKHLEDMDIPVVADLPVGENLQDHIFFGLHSKINKSIGLTQESFKSFSSLISYQLFGTGPLTSSGVEATAFMKIGEKKKENLYPDLQIALFSVILNYNGLKLNNKVRDNYERFVEDVDGFTFSIINTHPKSRGHIRLRTNDPF